MDLSKFVFFQKCFYPPSENARGASVISARSRSHSGPTGVGSSALTEPAHPRVMIAVYQHQHPLYQKEAEIPKKK